MTAPPRRGVEQATIRGIVVLVVAVVIGVALLAKAGKVGDTVEAGSSRSTSTTSTTAATLPPTTAPPASGGTGTQTTRPAGQVKVIVVNASGQSGVAGTNTQKASSAGFGTLPATNAPAAAKTTVYFASGYAGDAAAVAKALGLTSAPTAAAPAQPIVPQAAQANVIVVLGADYKAG
ncbi:MAG: LytR C-terminal domain-containing protein [Actinobacteria bacterium]|nr:LytR C-terminal domain-containing protein [Actinomycetota bacterium]